MPFYTETVSDIEILRTKLLALAIIQAGWRVITPFWQF